MVGHKVYQGGKFVKEFESLEEAKAFAQRLPGLAEVSDTSDKFCEASYRDGIEFWWHLQG